MKRWRRSRPAELQIAQILAWADALHQRTGHWPGINSGRIVGTPRENWRKVDSALRLGLRGLPGQSSLPKLLAEQRGVRNSGNLPKLTIEQILDWADLHCQRTGHWPKETSGPIHDADSESWHAVDRALRAGVRGLPGGTSLPALLSQGYGVRNLQRLPRLTIRQILRWVDQHHDRTGAWPSNRSGPIADTPGETWCGVDAALHMGRRRLPGGTTLKRLLAQKRGVRNPYQLPALTRQQILEWADAFFQSTGTWPRSESGPIPRTNGETWRIVDSALKTGCRGVKRKTTLARLLRRYRGLA